MDPNFAPAAGDANLARGRRDAQVVNHIILVVAVIGQIFNVLANWNQRLAPPPLEHLQITGSVSNTRYRDRLHRQEPFDLTEFNDTWCEHHLRFRKEFVVHMASELFPFEEILRFRYQTQTGTMRSFRVPRIEALCVVLYRFARPERLIDMEQVFPHEKSDLSRIFNHTVIRIVETWGHCLDLQPEQLPEPALRLFSHAILRKCRRLPNCIGFVDGNFRPTARPVDYPLQNLIYSGHTARHGLKYQMLTFPNGLIGDCYGPDIGAANDRELMRVSELEDHVLRQLPLFNEQLGIPFVAFGDKGYNSSDMLWTPVPGPAANLTPEERDFNRSMSTVRVSVEHVFGCMRQLYQHLENPTPLRTMDSPVNAIFKCAVLFTNFHHVFYPNQIAQYFELGVPTLRMYLRGCRCV